MKRYLAVLMAFVMMMMTVIMPAGTVYATGNNTPLVDVTTSNFVKNDLKVVGTNSFGSLMANELDSSLEQQKENEGYNVFSVEVTGKEAKVSFETVTDASLVVAVYDETGVEMLATGSCEVSAGEKEKSIIIDMKTMPQYFYLRAFLIETESLRPLCTVYESPMYTQEMQEFLAKTTDDFDADKVLNLDDDKTNNYAVYSEDTKLISSEDGRNHVVAADENTRQYVIENADSQISSLQQGDIFACEYGDNEILIVKVASISIDGITATITGQETSLDEVFDYVKIDTEMGMDEAVIDSSTCGAGVIYKGKVESASDDVATHYENNLSGDLAESQNRDVEVGGKLTRALSYEFDATLSGGAKMTGGMELGTECGISASITPNIQYVEAKIDYSVKLNVSISGTAQGKIPLGYIGMSPVPGVLIEFGPSFVAEAEAKIDLSGTLQGTIGFSASNYDGINNLTTFPEFRPELKVEGRVYIGLSLEPKIKIISESVAKAGMDAGMGVEAKAEYSRTLKTDKYIHGCNKCLDGEISSKYSISAEVKFLNSEKWKYQLSLLDNSVKLADFYYSFDNKQFGWGTCPSRLYQVCIMVTDINGEKIDEISASGKTLYEKNSNTNGVIPVFNSVSTQNGKLTAYLKTGTHEVTINADTISVPKKIEIQNQSKTVNLQDEVISNDESGIPDANFYHAALEVVDKNEDGILTKLEAETCRMLQLPRKEINSIQGVQYFSNVDSLNFWDNTISDISALNGLTNLRAIDFQENSIRDISTLSGLTNLEMLDLDHNEVSDISALAGLMNLWYLSLNLNNISDYSALAGLTKLKYVYTSGNPVEYEKNSKSSQPGSNHEDRIENKKTNIDNLLPNETYNFYLFKSAIGEKRLNSANLLYIGQAVSDASGRLDISYKPRMEYDDAVMLVVGMTRMDIAQSEVELSNLSYNGQEQYVNPVVQYKGTVLVEGKDYEISGDFSAAAPGEYTVIITGIGKYKGTKTVQYSVTGKKAEAEQINAFVERLYTLVLGREADGEGIESWSNVLMTLESSGIDVGYGFVFSEECQNRGLSNEDFVEILYNTFMDRASDEGGKKAWLEQLDAGVGREKVFEGFVLSPEYVGICEEYGINLGKVEDVEAFANAVNEYHNRNADITQFVARCYTKAMGRPYDPAGLEDWCRVIITQDDTPTNVAKCFIFSDEFVDKGLSDEEYVKVLYRTFMGREADDDGLSGWVGVLKSGEEDREKVLDGFANSLEFAEILEGFGLN